MNAAPPSKLSAIELHCKRNRESMQRTRMRERAEIDKMRVELRALEKQQCWLAAQVAGHFDDSNSQHAHLLAQYYALSKESKHIKRENFGLRQTLERRRKSYERVERILADYHLEKTDVTWDDGDDAMATTFAAATSLTASASAASAFGFEPITEDQAFALVTQCSASVRRLEKAQQQAAAASPHSSMDLETRCFGWRVQRKIVGGSNLQFLFTKTSPNVDPVLAAYKAWEIYKTSDQNSMDSIRVLRFETLQVVNENTHVVAREILHPLNKRVVMRNIFFAVPHADRAGLCGQALMHEPISGVAAAPTRDGRERRAHVVGRAIRGHHDVARSELREPGRQDAGRVRSEAGWLRGLRHDQRPEQPLHERAVLDPALREPRARAARAALAAAVGYPVFEIRGYNSKREDSKHYTTVQSTNPKPPPAASHHCCRISITQRQEATQTAAMSSSPASAAPAAAPSASPAPSHASSPPQELSAHRQGDAPSQDPVEKSVVLPRCSTWFSMDAINPIEKRMLPEFFVNEALYRNFPPGAKSNASKTPQIYLKYRNFMINAYRQQPQVYLTATACRRNLAGDACAILRVHEFLTHWGLINYSVPPHATPPSIHPNYALKPAVIASSSSLTPASASHGAIAVLHEMEKQGARRRGDRWNWRCEACALGEIQFELAPEAKKKVVEILNNGNVGPATSGANGAAGVKEMAIGAFCVAPGTGLCDDCYLSRACFPEGIDAADFVRVEKRPQWMQEETTALLEAVASSGKDSDESCDWNTIAAKVRSKTAEECMLHFLELPILQRAAGVDALGALSSLSSSSSSSSADVDVLQRPFGYAQAMNVSVLDMSALVSQVDPFVAKAAARASIRAVQQLHTMAATAATAAAESARDLIKAEPSAAAPVHANGDLGSSLEQAAAAVASSGQAAGISLKAEADADVEMKDTEGGVVASPNAALLSKEVVAVAKEAANGTAAALLAVRAHTVADASARGPVRDLVTQLLENQLQQMELKLQQVSVLEKTLAAEKDALALERYQLYVDRLAFAQEKLGGGV